MDCKRVWDLQIDWSDIVLFIRIDVKDDAYNAGRKNLFISCLVFHWAFYLTPEFGG